MPSPHKHVKEFHMTFGIELSSTPTLPSDQIRNARKNLIKEEVAEYLEAEQKNDLAAIARELADIVYVVYGAALTYGIPLDEVLAEVHRANMSKLVDGKPVRGENGKVVKGPDFVPPDVKKILER